MKVDLAEELEAAIEYKIYLIDVFLVVADLCVNDMSILDYATIVQLSLVHIGVFQIAIQVVQLVEIERVALVGDNIEEKKLLGLLSGISATVTFD